MKTNVYPRTIFIFLALFTLLVSCKPVDNPRYQQIRDQAATLAAGQTAAMNLVGDHMLQEIAPNLWAIDKATAVAAGTFMLFNDSQNVAIFVAQGATAPNGFHYTFIGAIDITHNTIVDAAAKFEQLGIDLKEVNSLEQLKCVLRNNGFSELTETTAPMLLATIRLGIRYLKTAGASVSTFGGNTIVDILAIPIFMLTPETMYPWCQGGKGCQTIQQ